MFIVLWFISLSVTDIRNQIISDWEGKSEVGAGPLNKDSYPLSVLCEYLNATVNMVAFVFNVACFHPSFKTGKGSVSVICYNTYGHTYHLLGLLLFCGNLYSMSYHLLVS